MISSTVESPATEPQHQDSAVGKHDIPSAESLLRMPEQEYVALVARHWDDPDWAEFWKQHVLAAVNDHDRRQLLHATVKACAHPTLDTTLHISRLTRLQWAGLIRERRCPLEKELIPWAIQTVQKWEPNGLPEQICLILAGWHRDLDEYLLSVLRKHLRDTAEISTHRAIHPVLLAHPGDIAHTVRAILVATIPQHGKDKPGNEDTVALACESLAVLAARRPDAKQHIIDAFIHGKPGALERPALAQCATRLLKDDPTLLAHIVQRWAGANTGKAERGPLAAALSPLAPHMPELLHLFHERLKHKSLTRQERLAICQALVAAANDQPELRKELITIFTNTAPHVELFQVLAVALAPFAETDASFRAIYLGRFLLQTIGHAEYAFIGNILARHIHTDPHIAKTLLTLVHQGKGPDKQRAALIGFFTHALKDSPESLTILTLRLQSKHPEKLEREALIQVLAPHAQNGNDITKALIAKFHSADPDSGERHRLAQALADVPNADATTLQAPILHLAHTNRRKADIVHFVACMARHALNHPDIKDTILQSFDTTPENDELQNALATAIYQFSKTDPALIHLLTIRYLRPECPKLQRLHLADIHCGLAASDPAVAQMLTARLAEHNTSDKERELIAWHLAPLAVDNAQLRDHIIDYLGIHPERHTHATAAHYWQIIRLHRLSLQSPAQPAA